MKTIIFLFLFSLCFPQTYITNDYGIITNNSKSYIFSYSNMYYATEDVMYSIANSSKKYYKLLEKYKELSNTYIKLSNEYKKLDNNMSNQIVRYKDLYNNEKIKSKFYKEIVIDTEEYITEVHKQSKKDKRKEKLKNILYYTLGIITCWGSKKLP